MRVHAYCIRPCTSAGMYTGACASMHAYAPARMQKCRNAQLQKCTTAEMQKCRNGRNGRNGRNTDMHGANAQLHTCLHACVPNRVPAHSRACRAAVRAHSCMRAIRADISMAKRMHALTHSHALASTCTHSHTLTRTPTHLHAPASLFAVVVVTFVHVHTCAHDAPA